MATRYKVLGPVSLPTKGGFAATFNPDRYGYDGQPGYSAEELSGLTAQQIKDHFTAFEYEVVEKATAAPGEKRTTAKK